MASITNLIRGTNREYISVFGRAGANVERAGDCSDEVLAGFPDPWGLTQDTAQQLAIEWSREVSRLGRRSLRDQPIRVIRVMCARLATCLVAETAVGYRLG